MGPFGKTEPKTTLLNCITWPAPDTPYSTPSSHHRLSACTPTEGWLHQSSVGGKILPSLPRLCSSVQFTPHHPKRQWSDILIGADHIREYCPHLIDMADMSILGMTDARIDASRTNTIKKLFCTALPRGTFIIPFCTEKPFAESNRKITMGGQLFIIDRHCEK